MKIEWVKYKDYQGARCKGVINYNPITPFGPWTKIIGVVARCEGNIDTVISFDESGLSFGIMQWTFKSGRLQKLLESFKSISSYDFGKEDKVHDTLFDNVCCSEGDERQIFEAYDFRIKNGKFESKLDNWRPLNPAVIADQKRIIDVCMGRAQYKDFASQKKHVMGLAQIFVDLGKQFGVADAQIAFAKQEFKRALDFYRKPLGNIETIRNLLKGTWDTPAPALFFNLWQNNPGAAFKLFLKVKKSGAQGWVYFEMAWLLANKSQFGNWGWKPGNKSPRVTRIRAAIKEFYDIDLNYIKS